MHSCSTTTKASVSGSATVLSKLTEFVTVSQTTTTSLNSCRRCYGLSIAFPSECQTVPSNPSQIG